MTGEELILRRGVVLVRMAEIAALLAQSKHLWVTTGRESQRGLRSGLEAEASVLNLERVMLAERIAAVAATAAATAAQDRRRCSANSFLEAAAADLLAALLGVLRVADRKTVEFDAARAAIAKALGPDKVEQV